MTIVWNNIPEGCTKVANIVRKQRKSNEACRIRRNFTIEERRRWKKNMDYSRSGAFRVNSRASHPRSTSWTQSLYPCSSMVLRSRKQHDSSPLGSNEDNTISYVTTQHSIHDDDDPRKVQSTSSAPGDHFQTGPFLHRVWTLGNSSSMDQYPYLSLCCLEFLASANLAMQL